MSAFVTVLVLLTTTLVATPGVPLDVTFAAAGLELYLLELSVAKANVSVGTLVTTSALGSVIVHENEVINLTGQSITAGLSDVTPQAAAIVSISGVSATASPGFIMVYSLIDTDQTPSYSEVSTTQTAGYTEVATTQSPNYTTIDAGRDEAA